MKRDLLNALLINPRLRLVAGDALRLPVFDRLPMKAGRIHEWFSMESIPGQWHPPLTIMASLAYQAGREHSRVVWIGRKCWPTFQVLAATDPAGCGALALSVFLDPPTEAERFWAAGQALRCPGVHAVIADGSGMTPTISRRLQLAAESALVLGLIARPSWEINEPSCAATRWQVRPCNGDGPSAAWSIELLRCRGQQVGQDVPQYWNADWMYQVFRGTGTFHLSPGMGRGTGTAPHERFGGEQALPRTA